ncbi:MAG: transcriptional repressor [Clostridiales bacterium]|nr:transcriptional repressor [Candidatus Blautia equi]
MERRNTIQRELVLQAVRTLKRHVTAEEIFEFLHQQHPYIGKGTVYRNLNILASEGEIRKVEISDGPDRFDFTLKEHYHVECICCHDVSDVDLEALPDLIPRIHDHHGMKFMGYDILFKGLCESCQREAELREAVADD